MSRQFQVVSTATNKRGAQSSYTAVVSADNEDHAVKVAMPEIKAYHAKRNAGQRVHIANVIDNDAPDDQYNEANMMSWTGEHSRSELGTDDCTGCAKEGDDCPIHGQSEQAKEGRDKEEIRRKGDSDYGIRREATESLVDALAAGSATGIESSFKEAMSRRLLDTIEVERPNVVASLFDENGVFQKEEFVSEGKSNGAPAACPHCLKKVSGKGVYHNPPKVKIELGIEQAGFYHAKCHKEKFPDAVVEEFDLMESEEVLSEMAVPWPEKAPQLNQYKRTAQGSNVYAHPDGHRIELNPDTQELTHFPAGSTKGKKFAAGADIHPYLMKLHGGFDELVKKHDADASRSWGDDMRLRHKMGSLDYAYKKAKKAGTLTPEDHAKMAVDYKAMHRAVMNGQRRERIAARAKYDAFNSVKQGGSVKEAADYAFGTVGTPGCKGCENDGYNGVCMDCTRARAKSATSRGGCKCGKKKVPGEVKKVGSRSWIPCERCFGQIAQLS